MILGSKFEIIFCRIRNASELTHWTFIWNIDNCHLSSVSKMSQVDLYSSPFRLLSLFTFVKNWHNIESRINWKVCYLFSFFAGKAKLYIWHLSFLNELSSRWCTQYADLELRHAVRGVASGLTKKLLSFRVFIWFVFKQLLTVIYLDP